MATYKKKVDKLTFYNGRLYQAGETVEFLAEDAEAAKVHYGETKPATSEPTKAVSERTPGNGADAKTAADQSEHPADVAAKKQVASVKAAKTSASE